MDTPGGLDEPMREIIKKMAGSPLPVIVYVSPTGARAASAGTFICMGSDVCAMAPGTNLGAAHPVAVGAEPDTETGIKITNDAAAYMRSLAEANGRNANWAELAVRQSVSLSADDALDQQVIDMKADSMQALLDQVDGFTTKAKQITIETQGAEVSEAGMTFREKVLHLIVDPNVAYLLFIIGLLAIAYEFVHPGIGIGGILGFICLVLSLYALNSLPINYTGIGLIVLGILFLGAELYLPSHGALTVGGIVALLAGSFFLYDSSAPFLRVSLPLNIALASLATVFFVVIARAAIQARRLPRQSPRSAMIGAEGVTRTMLDPLGQVFVRGEIWSAEAPEGETIEKGEEIEVTDVSGLLLKVRKT
jgi:membrane-bound serine protease (ClpP class)